MGSLHSLLADDRPEHEGDEQQGPTEAPRAVRAMLLQLGLPPELILDIMDLAEYYSVVRAERADAIELRADSFARQDNCSARLYLLSAPLPRAVLEDGERWKIRKVAWTVEGHDQGWGGLPQNAGTFEGAFSWYEACIYRPDPSVEDSKTGEDAESNAGHDARANAALVEFLDAHQLVRKTADVREKLRAVGWSLVPNPDPDDEFVWRVQSNRVARREFERHTVEWRPGQPFDATDAAEHGYGDGTSFLAALQPGDRVGLWMRAMYGGWMNYVREASVELMYEVL